MHNTLFVLYLTIFSFFRRHRHSWLNVMAELQETILPWCEYSEVSMVEENWMPEIEENIRCIERAREEKRRRCAFEAVMREVRLVQPKHPRRPMNLATRRGKVLPRLRLR